MGQSSYWGPLKTPIMRLYVVGQEYFLNTPPAHLAPVGLIGVMGTVFLAWKVKRWEPFMRKWWLHRPVILGSGAARQWQNSVTLFTSTVSTLYQWSRILADAFIAISPIAASLRLQLLRSILLRSSRLLLHCNTSPNHGASITKFHAYTSLFGIPASSRSCIITFIAHVDKPRQATKAHPHTLVTGSNILSSGASRSSGNTAQFRG
jgi:hypothetical protein